MSSDKSIAIGSRGFAKTLRKDNWWLYPGIVLFGLTSFLIYGFWSAWQADFYWYSAGQEGFGGYLAPFYSPLLFIKEGVEGAAPIEHAIFGSWPGWWPSWLPPSPSLLILAIPGIFRFTCYYYRKAYYRAFTGTPPACAVGALPRKRKAGYKGETGLMVVQNLHRYAMYFAMIYIVVFFYDAYLSFFRGGELGVGVGSILILGNPILLACYSFGCHSIRHLLYGSRDCYSCSMNGEVAHKNGKIITWLNQRHELFAWLSLIWIMVADFYIRLVSMGIITDLNTWALKDYVMIDISEIRTIEHDVLIVGAGGAGLSAAIEASSRGMSTGIVMKSLLGKAHTVMAEGGMAAALANVDERDHWKIHFRDTMRGGKFLNAWRMAELHAKIAPERVRLLEEWGAVFDRTKNGLINQRNFGGHRYPRLAHVGDRTGLEMIRTLQDHGIHQGIQAYMECTALDLLKSDTGEVCGVVCMWRESGTFTIFKAKSIIFATGGGGKAWEVTSNSWEYTGDGYALAYEAGAELMDLEFNQFHPTGMVWPLSVKGTLVTESVRGEGGILLNSEGTRFMFNYIPERFRSETADTEEEAARWLAGDLNARRPPELLTRDVVARAINAEVKAGRGSKHGGAYLNIATQRSAEDIKRKLPSMYHQFKVLAELDITKEPMEVGPTCHYFMGGIRVDAETTMSSVAGLFACGECAAGLHGANRLGGNSLSDLLVFGYLSGKHASEYAKKMNTHLEFSEEQASNIIKNATSILNRESGANPYLLHEDLEGNMQANVGIIRTEEELKKGIAKLEEMKLEYKTVKAKGASQFNPGWHEALGLRNLLITAEAVARAALLREESRGAHTRADFPGEQADWLNFNIVTSKGADGNMQLKKVERPKPDAELERIAKSTIEDLEEEILKERGG